MKKKALLIGINYIDTPKELSCCINDLKSITTTLVNEFSFNMNNILFLIEDMATKKNILDGMEWLVQELETGDIGVLFYAGHGTQVGELPPLDEPDKLDEAIIPYDAINGNKIIKEQLIRDNDIAEKFSRLATDVHFFLISDSCHSGTISRGPTPRRVIPKDDVSYNEIKEIVKSNTSPTRRKYPTRNPFARAIENNYFLSACKADDLAYEYEDGSNGYLTKEVVKYMKKGMTYQEFYNLVLSGVKEVSRDKQEPQIEGPSLNRKILE